ncbi:virulence factor Mce [Mycolicibacterium duvalii]|uniref:Virulence factor Mce n=1 Tax=Mycolicibacterium duvalii TaxID=39688 RepID=A0A7I7K277_9MYCO|nr:MlaD family protein [Mycolicibacterium duvalii]MCV7370164.1 MCE family protein [Mycolicibacterium duvalii]PEG38483.1 virulence factor Mce [Mycolicibacterium duvalii]BBX17472.1 virulence factor Mce [Mycolicibacterium duvalii]
MLTGMVRIQLTLFAIASIVGISVMVVQYIRVPTLLGVGRLEIALQLPEAGGLYRFANVTYRGVQIGKVTAVDVHRDGALATLSLADSPRVPADLQAEVRSVSAVGEQYVDLQPRTDSGPYLEDGAVIPTSAVTVPQQVAPMMRNLSALVTSIPKDKLDRLLDESFTAFHGAGYDLQTLTESTSRIAADTDSVADRTSALIEDSAPVLDGQVAGADALATWSARLAALSAQLVARDPEIRTIIESGSPAAQEVSQLLEQVRPTLPVLLANLTSLGQVGLTYRPGLEQLLVLLPPASAFYQSAVGSNNATGIPVGDFRISVDDPPACTVGFLPPSSWRSPADTTTIDTPDGLYCKLPQDSPIAVRGVRNLPCMDVPGKRAPTVELCRSDRGFQPLAARQHALGPYPFDPNLIGQGVAPDDRVTRDERLFSPPAGTPMPPEAPPPSPVAVATYDPQTGRVATDDGRAVQQTDLVAPADSWEDLVWPTVP